MLPAVLNGVEQVGEVTGGVGGGDFRHVIRLSDYAQDGARALAPIAATGGSPAGTDSADIPASRSVIALACYGTCAIRKVQSRMRGPAARGSAPSAECSPGGGSNPGSRLR